jgi:hypothetical protein
MALTTMPSGVRRDFAVLAGAAGVSEMIRAVVEPQILGATLMASILARRLGRRRVTPHPFELSDRTA